MTTWRYIAQRAITGEMLDLDLPFRRDQLSWSLSGPGSLEGTVSPDVGTLRARDGRLLLEEWGTFLYAEADGIIRWGGIVISSAFNGEDWKIEAAGFTTYPHGLPFDGDFSGIHVDPADAFRTIWSNVQNHPDGNLGVLVTNEKTAALLGEEGYLQYEDGRISSLSYPDPTYVPAGATIVDPKPYELRWWNTPDCGEELDKLAKETPFDYSEEHFWIPTEPVGEATVQTSLLAWMLANGWVRNGYGLLNPPANSPATGIAHVVRIHYPRVGRLRTDLAFVQGDNVSEVVAPTIEGDDFANFVIGLGAGEGSAMLRREVGQRDGRLRRVHVYTDKGELSAQRLDSTVRRELAARRNMLEITEITVRNHDNAPIGSWQVGDDIIVQATLPWLGQISLKSRVVGWSLTSDDTATLSLARSDSFRYGG